MLIKEFAEHILFSDSLEDKLVEAAGFSDEHRESNKKIPENPARPRRLIFSGEKTKLAPAEQLSEPAHAAQLLHSFANHELLALELMALVLLRFPNADTKFRRGLVATMQDEQRHLNLYMTRIKELGFEFGDFPVNEYFWNLLHQTQSPLDFVTHMSLTLEQANLDFASHYIRVFKSLNDHQTAEILETVHQDEIRHVSHGLVWFDRWRDNKQSRWQAYQRLLRHPMTPAKAKAMEFDEVSRKKAGIDPDFMDNLRFYRHSKGRSPDIYVFNPSFESELASKDFNAPKASKLIENDLAILMLFLAKQDDVCMVNQTPSSSYFKQLEAAGFNWCQVCNDWQELKTRRTGKLIPWGSSPSVYKNIPNSPSYFPRDLASKVNIKKRLVELETPYNVGSIVNSTDEISTLLAANKESSFVIKSPFSTSARSRIKIDASKAISEHQIAWLEKNFSLHKQLVIEPWLKKCFDYSLLFKRQAKRLKYLGHSFFFTDSRGQYKGHYLGNKNYFDIDLRALHSLDAISHSRKLVESILNSNDYEGHLGADGLIFQNHGQKLFALVEINPRYTMGHIALQLEKRILSSVPACWLHLSLKEVQAEGYSDFKELSESFSASFPIVLKDNKLESGIVFTNDPLTSQNHISFLLVGEKACKKLKIIEKD